MQILFAFPPENLEVYADRFRAAGQMVKVLEPTTANPNQALAEALSQTRFDTIFIWPTNPSQIKTLSGHGHIGSVFVLVANRTGYTGLGEQFKSYLLFNPFDAAALVFYT